MKRKWSCLLLALCLFAAGLAGCAQTATPAATGSEPTAATTNGPASAEGVNVVAGEGDTGALTQATEAPAELELPTEFGEAPMLAEQVEAGTLPPVEERLPLVPKLANDIPADEMKLEIGNYGGTMRQVGTGTFSGDVFIMCDEAIMNSPGLWGKEITANVLESYEMSQDMTTYTCKLRQGMKWSDGEPVTMEDVTFAYNDVQKNLAITSAVPTWLRTGNSPSGSPAELTVIDDWTFQLTFDGPYGGFMAAASMMGWRAYTDLIKPAHYLKAYHPDYGDAESLARAIELAGVDASDATSPGVAFNYMDITNWEMHSEQAIGFPALWAWVIESSEQDGFTLTRNPYYFKVDAAGNQLPYIDKIDYTIVQNSETLLLKTLAGETDFVREATSLTNMSLYRENEQNGFTAYLALMHANPTLWYLNLTNADEDWRAVVRDQRFREALNYALNKDEMLNTLYMGNATISPYSDKGFDIDKANALLDEMGMVKGADGVRTAPDGKEFMIQMETDTAGADFVPGCELVTEYWNAIGVKTTLKQITSELKSTRVSANEMYAGVAWHSMVYYDFTSNAFMDNAAPLWASYYATNGENGEEPPEAFMEYMGYYEQMLKNPPAEAMSAMDKLLANLGENMWYFRWIETACQPLIVNSGMGNVSGSSISTAMNYAGATMYFK